MMKKLSVILAALTVLLASVSTASAGEFGVDVTFSDGEISIIQAYYRDQEPGGRNGKGKAGKGNKGLPPGIAKNLQQGKPLPPGIAKRALPSDLAKLLPPPPKGFERIEIDGKVLLVEIATQVIHDMLEDVILGR